MNHREPTELEIKVEEVLKIIEQLKNYSSSTKVKRKIEQLSIKVEELSTMITEQEDNKNGN